MAFSEKKRKEVEAVIMSSLRGKFEKYSPESSAMPFHTRLLGKDRLALYSFIHSLNTNFGTSIFEPVARELAQEKFVRAETQMTAGSSISLAAQRVIQEIIDGLTSASSTPNKEKEVEMIRNVCQRGEMKKIKTTRVDLFLETTDHERYFIDIKTAKPNAGGFKEFKRTLLEWVAVVLAEDPLTKIHTLVAIPYNPYEPKPYDRWTIRGMLDMGEELKVAQEFWDFLSYEGAYQDLLDCFERVGIFLREEIDSYFSRFRP